MFGATAYELMDVAQSGTIGDEDWAAFAVAFIASAVTAFIAVKWLLTYIQTHRFTLFAIYRIVLGALPVSYTHLDVYKRQYGGSEWD